MQKLVTNYGAMIKRLCFVLLGNSIYALGIAMFILPNGLMTGGTTGLGLSMNHYFGIPISIFVAAFNIVMFLLGFWVLGKSFAMTTIISTFYYPWILDQFQKIETIQHMTDDMMLSVVLAGLMIGLGIGVVIKAGASTGGMDIPPLILNKKLRIPVSVSLYVFDFMILISQMFFSNQEQILYGILLVIIYTAVLNKVLLMGDAKVQVKIVSAEYEKINTMIQEKLDRGTTLLEAKTGYLKRDSYMVLTVISNRELAKLHNLVQSVDPKAFLIVHQVSEVAGRGFTLKKKYK